jgi:hypothetical protein
MRVRQRKPQGCYPYWDRLTAWFKKPLEPSEFRHLESLNRPNSDPPHKHWGKCPYNPSYKQSITLHQPTDEQIRYLAKIRPNGVMLTFVEIACDYTFSTQSEANRCVEWCRDHLLQPYHRATMHVHAYVQGFTSRSTPKGGRKKGSWQVGYASKPCRITGEVHCFHIETKHSGKPVLHRLGIDHLLDLLTFDFERHFVKHLTSYEIDFERLGRFHRNRQSGSKSKQSRVQHFGKAGFVYNHDHRLGGTLYNSLALHRYDPEGDDRSLQRFVDLYGRGPFLTQIPFQPYRIDIHRHKFITSQQTIAAQPFPANNVEKITTPKSLRTSKTPVSQ